MALAPIPFSRTSRPGVPGADDDIELLGVPSTPQGARTLASPSDEIELLGMAPQGDQSGMSEFERTIVGPVQRGAVDFRDMMFGARQMLGLDTPEQYARGIVENELARQAVPQHPDDVRFAQELDAAEGWDAVGKVVTNPRLWAQTAIQSIVGNAAPSLLLGATGNVVGGPVGAVAGGAGGSFLGEFNASVMDALREADPTIVADPQALLSALGDEQIMGRAKDYAMKRGLAVAAFDGISMGLAGRVFTPVKQLAGGKLAGSLAGVAAEGVSQAALGAAGEATAQLASTGEIGKPGDVALEALAGVPMGAGEAAATAPGRVLDAARQRQQAQPDEIELLGVGPLPPEVPTEPVDNPNVAFVDPASLVPPLPQVAAQAAPPPEAPATPVLPAPVAPMPAPPPPPPLAGPIQPEPTPVAPATPLLPQAPQVQPQPAPVQPEPAPVQPAPVQPAPAPAPSPVSVAPVANPVPPPTAEPAPSAPPAPASAPGETGPRLAPDPNASFLRFGRALSVIEQSPTAGLTAREKRVRASDLEKYRRWKPGDVIEDETPQQFRIGDEVATSTGKYGGVSGTVFSVKNVNGAVTLDVIGRDGKVTSGVKAESIVSHNQLAQDTPTPAKRPAWYGKAEPNEKGVKPGDTVTLKNGTSGKVVGVWKSTELGKAQGFTRKPINVAIQPEGSPDGTYRMTGLDGITSTNPAAPAAVQPEVQPEPGPAPANAATPDTDTRMDTATLNGADNDADMERDAADFPSEYGVYRDDRRARGTLAPQTLDVSRTSGPSPFRAAWLAAGLDPDEGNNLAPRRKIEVLRDVLVKTFGFQNVRWAGADPQQAVAQMQNAFRNVQFMMHVLSLPIKAVSLDGTLTVDLESERRPYFGVYNPARRAIGMPGQSNSFAHEWMHALDHYIGEKLTGVDRLLSKIARSDGLDTTQSIEEAFVKLLYTMFYDKADLAARALDLERKAAATILSGPKAGQPTVAAEQARRQLENLKAGATQLQIKPTDYAMKTRNFDPSTDYWASAHEMLARAFEAYIAHKMAMAGGTNEFVTKGEEAYLSDADRRLAMTFPKDQDRVRIFAALDELFDHLRANAVLGTDAPADAPTDAGIVDPNRWHKIVSRQANPNLFDQMREEASRLKQLAADAARQGLLASLKLGVSRLSLNAGLNPNATWAGAGKALLDYTRFFLFTTRGATMPLIRRNKARKNKKTGKIERGGGDLLEDAFGGFATRPGTGTEQAVTYEGESHQQTAKDASKIESVLKANGYPSLDVPEADKLAIREVMFGRSAKGVDPKLVKIASQLRDLFDAAHARAKAAGVKIGYLLDQGYLPRVLDMGKVAGDPMGFIKKATELYRVVFDDLVGDPNFTERDLISLANVVDKRLGNTTNQNRFAAEIKALRKALRDTAKAEGALKALKSNAKATPAQIAAAQQKVSDAADAVQSARDELADVLRDPFSELSAREWQTRVQVGDSFTYEGHGPGEKYTEKRKLPPEADDILADFYNTDPINLTANYVANMNARTAYVKRAGNPSGTDRIEDVVARQDVKNRIAMRPGKYRLDTEEGRRAIISDLANPATDNLLEMRLRSAFEMGADPQDVLHVRRSIESIAGRGERGLFADMLQRFSGAIYAYTYIRLLPRMALTALTEPAAMMLRTGDAKATLSTFLAYMAELNQSAKSVQERAEIARAIGLISSPLYDVLLMSRMGMDTGHIASPNVLMARFFQANFASAITNAQRRATMLGGFVWMRDMAQKHALSKDAGDKKVIEAEFKELGVREEDLTSFMDWLAQSDNLPDLDALNSKAGRVFEAAIYRFVGQTIQDPNRADKPMLASTALGRLAFSLTSFLYTFFSNVHAATVSRTMRDYQIYRDAGRSKLSAGANAATGAVTSFAGGFALIWAGQLLTTTAREFLFNHEQWEEHEEEEDLFAWLAGLAGSRTGILGPADILMNSLTGLKYERDLSNMVVGPGIQSILGDGANIVRLFSSENSPNTNTAEREAAKAVYRLAIAPTLGAVLSAANTLGPVTEGARYGALVSLTSNGAASIFADWVAGPKPDKDAPEPRLSAAERSAARRADREEAREKRREKREERREEREKRRRERD